MGTALGGSGLSFLFWGVFCGRKSRSFTPLIVTSLQLTNLEREADAPGTAGPLESVTRPLSEPVSATFCAVDNKQAAPIAKRRAKR